MKPHCNPYQVVQDFERAIAEYTGAPYCVAVNSCTMALLLAVRYELTHAFEPSIFEGRHVRPPIEIPKRTYVSVPMSILHAGARPTFRDEDWEGRLIALCDPSMLVISLAIVETLDIAHGTIRFRSPAKCLNDVTSIQVGSLRLDGPYFTSVQARESR